MSYIQNMAVILKSKYADPVLKERTRQQVIHAAFLGDPEALDITGELEAKECPCTHCLSTRSLAKVRAETYK